MINAPLPTWKEQHSLLAVCAADLNTPHKVWFSRIINLFTESHGPGSDKKYYAVGIPPHGTMNEAEEGKNQCDSVINRCRDELHRYLPPFDPLFCRMYCTLINAFTPWVHKRTRCGATSGSLIPHAAFKFFLSGTMLGLPDLSSHVSRTRRPWQGKPMKSRC